MKSELSALVDSRELTDKIHDGFSLRSELRFHLFVQPDKGNEQR
jgi:hypothetical protein